MPSRSWPKQGDSAIVRPASVWLSHLVSLLIPISQRLRLPMRAFHGHPLAACLALSRDRRCAGLHVGIEERRSLVGQQKGAATRPLPISINTVRWLSSGSSGSRKKANSPPKVARPIRKKSPPTWPMRFKPSKTRWCASKSCRTLATIPNETAAAVLYAGMKDPDPEVRVAICEGWGRRVNPNAYSGANAETARSETSAATRILAEALAGDTNVNVRLAAAHSLGKIKNDPHRSVLWESHSRIKTPRSNSGPSPRSKKSRTKISATMSPNGSNTPTASHLRRGSPKQSPIARRNFNSGRKVEAASRRFPAFKSKQRRAAFRLSGGSLVSPLYRALRGAVSEFCPVEPAQAVKLSQLPLDSRQSENQLFRRGRLAETDVRYDLSWHSGECRGGPGGGRGTRKVCVF